MNKKNYSLYGLPEEIKFCKKCVISNQRPNNVVEFKSKDNQKKGIAFSSDDLICDACNYNEKKKEINWKEREIQLIDLLSKYKKKSGYDCVVPGSGGKDSAFTAHILKYKYGMNPLTVTWAPHLYTNIGWQNFTNWMHVGGLDNILFTPNGKLHRTLTSLAFKNFLHPFQPFIIGQKIIGPLIASKFNIPLIFYGENQAECGNPTDDNSNPKMDEKFFSKNKNEEIVLGGEPVSKIIKDYNYKINDFGPYMPPDIDELNKKKIEQRYLGYYLRWDWQECYYYAAKHTGFRPNSERTEGTYSKYAGIDDKMDTFHYYFTFIKFGIGRATHDASQEVRTDKITREEAVNLVKQFDAEFPKKYFNEFLEYVNISKEGFFETVDKFRSPHLWTKVNGEWSLNKKVFKS